MKSVNKGLMAEVESQQVEYVPSRYIDASLDMMATFPTTGFVSQMPPPPTTTTTT
jgi:hypothetical protein